MWRRHWRYFFLGLIFLFDLLIVYLSFHLAYTIRFHFPWIVKIFPVTKGIPEWEPYHRTAYVIVFFWGIIFIYSRFYREKFLSALDEFIQVFKGVTAATTLTVGMTFFYREFEYSRLVIGFTWLINIFSIYVFHEAMKLFSRFWLRKFLGPRRILVLGKGKIAQKVCDYLKLQPHLKSHYLPEIKKTKFEQIIKKRNISEVIFAQFPVDHNHLLEISERCEQLGLEFKFVPDILALKMGELTIDGEYGLPVLGVKPVSLQGTNFFFKRFLDVLGSILIISLSLPFLLFVCLLIYLDSPGPILYFHLRKGYRGKVFYFYKFRTMVKDADERLKELKDLSQRGGPVFKLLNDPRITRVGKILRKYSLDELPQLINVLRGEMSLIGPRPQVLWEAEHYDDYAKRRLKLLPGVTGLWQVSGRADLSYEDMIRLDIYYLENWSLGLDLKILLKTIPAILSRKGAY